VRASSGFAAARAERPLDLAVRPRPLAHAGKNAMSVSAMTWATGLLPTLRA